MRIQTQNTSISMDIDNGTLDMKQLFFNNLQLLGFDAPAMEATNHIPFNKTMFDLPNKRGAEIVLHFLFQRLNPTLCKENFRDCWPILDKKREQGFRKTCSNWLTNISQEEPDSHLPRINASLFMSPGGEKFYQLLFHFSGYVLQKVLETELGSKMSERLKYPVLTPQNLQLAEVIIKDLTCSSVRHRTNYFSVAQLNVKASKSWRDTSDDYVKEYRKLNKEIRELEYKVREEEQKSVETSLARGSPGKRPSSHSDHFDPQFDPRTIKRAQRIQQVRDMWKQLEDFDRNEAAEREVVESIVERTINKFKLDAADISVKVPDMLLRECGEEIRRRNVDNTYQGGKLNLVSVLQLWNLCLHLYLEKIKEVGVPKFEEEIQKLTSQVHVQQNYAQNAQTLRQQMSERIPVLKSSIEKLRTKLDHALFQDKSPESIRTTVSASQRVECDKMNACDKTNASPWQLSACKLDCRSAQNRTSYIPELGSNVNKNPENLSSKYRTDINKISNAKENGNNANDRKNSLFKQKAVKQKDKNIKLNHAAEVEKTCVRKSQNKEVSEKSDCRSRSLRSPLDIETNANCDSVAVDKLKVLQEHSIVDGDSNICAECGPHCICGQTAVAMVSSARSPDLSSVSAPGWAKCNGEQSFSLEALSDPCSSKPFSSGMSTMSSRLNNEKVTIEKVHEFEQMLRSENLHPDSLKDEFSGHTSVVNGPCTDLSLAGQSMSSGYMSFKNSEVSSLPDHNTVFDELLVTAVKPTLDVYACSSNKVTDVLTEVVNSAPLPVSGQVSLPCKSFKPLKDMHIEEEVPQGGVLSMSGGQICSLQSCLPLKDMTQEELETDNFNDSLQLLSSSVSPRHCKKFSPLKDMSFSEDSNIEDSSPCTSGECKWKVYKYVETKSADDDVITFCTETLSQDGPNSAYALTNEKFDMIRTSISNDKSVVKKVSRSYSSCEKFVNNDLKSVKTVVESDFKFYRSPKGTLKRVRFCFP